MIFPQAAPDQTAKSRIGSCYNQEASDRIFRPAGFRQHQFGFSDNISFNLSSLDQAVICINLSPSPANDLQLPQIQDLAWEHMHGNLQYLMQYQSLFYSYSLQSCMMFVVEDLISSWLRPHRRTKGTETATDRESWPPCHSLPPCIQLDQDHLSAYVYLRHFIMSNILATVVVLCYLWCAYLLSINIFFFQHLLRNTIQ